MSPALTLIQQSRRRLVCHKQLNVLGIFLPLTIIIWIIGFGISKLISIPHLWVILPIIFCGAGLGVALWKVRTIVGNEENVAALLDDKMQGKERFITLISTLHESPSVLDGTLFPVVQHQAEQLSKTFLLEQDLPFVLDRRVPWIMMAAIVSGFLFFLVPPHAEHAITSFFPLLQKQDSPREFTAEIADLEKTARLLLSPSSTPEEQLAGAQLSTLAQQLQDPSLSVPEKQKLIEEAQERLNLDLPFPQLFPFDLKLFSGQGKSPEDTGKGGDSQTGGKAESINANQNLEQLQQSLSGQMDNGPGQNEQRGESNKENPQPRSDGSGIIFNPPPQDQKQQSSVSASPPSPGSQQAKSQNQPSSPADTLGQPHSGLTSKVDPHQPGENPTNQSQSQQQDPKKPGKEQRKEDGGTTIGQGKGERFLKSGAQPGGGFLTKDARFVKVRVPSHQEETAAGDSLAASTNRVVPKIPYSNAPLKEGLPNQRHEKQPIPLEYRKILTE